MSTFESLVETEGKRAIPLEGKKVINHSLKMLFLVPIFFSQKPCR